MVFALVIFALFGGDMGVATFSMVSTAQSQLVVLRANAPYLVVLVLGLAWFSGLDALRRRLPAVVLAIVALIPFSAGFAVFKSHLPLAAGLVAEPAFFADPFFAAADKWLHFNTDPWVLTHAMLGWLDAYWVDVLYGLLWGVFIAMIPVLIALFDDDPRRIRTYVILYIFATVGIGNVLALAGMSAGPVYYDRIFDTDRFAGLTQALEAAGLTKGFIGSVQDGLWMLYASGNLGLGGGISAFPSVHVATTLVGALYAWDRNRILGVIAFVYLAIILILSVHTGYHYAVDGYASILVILLLRRSLRG